MHKNLGGEIKYNDLRVYLFNPEFKINFLKLEKKKL